MEDEENATESYTPFQQSLSDHTWDQHPLDVREFGPYINIDAWLSSPLTWGCLNVLGSVRCRLNSDMKRGDYI